MGGHKKPEWSFKAPLMDAIKKLLTGDGGGGGKFLEGVSVQRKTGSFKVQIHKT